MPMIVSAQVSIYPLRQEHFAPAIAAVQSAFTARGLAPKTGPMSTLVVGDAQSLFTALAE